MPSSWETDLGRRAFLCSGALTLAAPSLLGQRQRGGAPLAVAVAGLGRAGLARLHHLLQMPGVRVRAVCDVFESRQEAGRRLVDTANGDKECNAFSDFRDLLRAEDLDAVLIATPDHWHGWMIRAAFRAGVDVFCESPLTLTVDEGREIQEEAERTGRLLQTGMDWRGDPVVARLVALVRGGHLGAIRAVRGEVEPGRAFERVAADPIGRRIPDGFRYDLWLGPAPAASYHPKRCSGFRWIRDYAGGRMTGQGLALVDIADQLLAVDGAMPVEIRGRGEFPRRGLFDNPLRFQVEWRYPSGAKFRLDTTGRQVLTIEGTKGKLRYWPATGVVECDPKSLWTESPDDSLSPRSQNLVGNFVDCVLTRRRPRCPLEVGRRAADLCHLGGIVLETRAPVHWDAGRGTVVEPMAQRLLRRSSRPQWTMKM